MLQIMGVVAVLVAVMVMLRRGRATRGRIAREGYPLGALIDDVLVYCDGPDAYRISHGGGSLEDILPGIAQGREVTFTSG